MAITISYPTSASEIIVLLKIPKELQYLSSPAVLADVYAYHSCGPWYMSSFACTMACKPMPDTLYGARLQGFTVVVFIVAKPRAWFDEYIYHDSLQECAIEGIGHKNSDIAIYHTIIKSILFFAVLPMFCQSARD